MQPVSEAEVRASFVNASKGAVRRINLPPDLDGCDWDALEFLGWTDPKAPMQSYLVVPTERHGLVGVQMRRNTSAGGRSRMCSLCTTVHPGQGVTLMVAPRAGKAGRDGNSVGLDMCAGLECSLYARGLIPLPAMASAHETLPVEERVARLRGNVTTFVHRVLRAT